MKLLNQLFRLFIASIILLAFGADLYAQNTTVTVRGTVIDRKDRQPVIGAAVVEIDNDRRTIGGSSTDIEGNFALRVKNPNGRISISYIGYKSQTIEIKGRTQINISLEPSTSQLAEVTIVGKKVTNNGTGLNIDERNRTTAVATINAKDLEEMQAASIDQALQGRLPGVDIAATSGDPGAGMQIRIRGTSSINGATDPLIVVDGMPYETSVPQDFNFATADETGYAQLLNIAPSDIKDISVLKDAAATAVWGSRAANGVLVINTKRGMVGKPAIAYTFKGSLSKQPEAIPLLNGNQYSTLVLEEFFNANRPFSSSEFAKQFQYDPNDPYNYYNFSNNTDWVKAITRIGNMQDHNVSISGGGEKARYFASLGYFNQAGTTKGTDLNRINSRINLDYNVSNRIRFRSDIAYTHLDNSQLYSSTLRNVAYNKMPNMSVYEYDEFGNQTSNYFSPTLTAQGQFNGIDSRGRVLGTVNPLAMAEAAFNHQLGERIVPKFNLQYDIVPSILTSTADVMFDINNSKIKTFLPQIATGVVTTNSLNNRATDYDLDQFSLSTKLNLVFTPKLNEKHSLQSLLTLQSYDSRWVEQRTASANVASSFLQDASISARFQNPELPLVSYRGQTRNVAAMVNAQYGFLDRYLINVALRGDGNSKFGPGNRYGLFPSISTRYRLSGEPFMKKFTFLNDLSFRASYGESGNAPKYDYTFYNTYGTYDFTYLGQNGVVSNNMELTNLRWETVVGKNLGLNLAMFKNKLSVDVEVYRNRTKDLYYNDLIVASYHGYPRVNMNVGVMDNQGWELNFNATPLSRKKVRLDFNFNIAQNQNMIREISPLYPLENGSRITNNGAYKSYLQVDNPFGSFYGFRYKGVYSDDQATVARDKNGSPIVGPSGNEVRMRFNYPATSYIFQPGDAMYEDINFDGNIDYKDIVYLGNSNPKFTGGFGPTLTYKGNLKLNAYFTFRTGYELINATKMTTTNMYGYNNQSTAVLRRWKNIGDETDVPRAMYGTGYNWLGSSRYVEDGSFVRLRTVTLRYNLNKQLAQKFRLKGASIYSTVENIFTITKYTGQDPEVTTKINGPFSVAMDESMTPPIKTFTMGISAQF